MAKKRHIKDEIIPFKRPYIDYPKMFLLFLFKKKKYFEYLYVCNLLHLNVGAFLKAEKDPSEYVQIARYTWYTYGRQIEPQKYLPLFELLSNLHIEWMEELGY